MPTTTKPPQLTGRRPNIVCRRPDDTQHLPEPGTIIETASGEAMVYVGDCWPDPHLDLSRLAARLRPARKVILIGDIWAVGRPLKYALCEEWLRQKREARLAARPPQLPKAPAPRCGQARQDGKPCGLPAGWGTDGAEGPCKHHGGLSAARRLGEHALTVSRLAQKARTTQLTPRERLEGAIALRAVIVELRKPRRRR
ncbi:hypothetical protein ACFOSC_26590 [Streptantibioticus rubrisoli]|uniref:Uncharacterized protein n=1 Tax=Streptantibioticus rubrisoli TaxID=1387313 RepID=A0ABT1PEQ1_9ACTN|nr:hypothetical protein [Streptantibioticus rubrisoli]MCQ4043856.1 hypothetical protein [Streptantibioticus rubrisoli]